jgi:thiol-disulfide isomerase/thioredoxin
MGLHSFTTVATREGERLGPEGGVARPTFDGTQGWGSRINWALMRFWLSIRAGLICVAILAATGMGAGKKAPGLSLKTIAGESRKLADLRGQVVVVNFWATWCGPCQEELPRLSKLAAGYAGKPVKFVAVSIDDKKDFGKIPGTLQRAVAQLDVWVGADTDTMQRFGLGDIVPGTMIVDESGEVVTRVMGEAREEDVTGPVDWALGGKVGATPAAVIKRY